MSAFLLKKSLAVAIILSLSFRFVAFNETNLLSPASTLQLPEPKFLYQIVEGTPSEFEIGLPYSYFKLGRKKEIELFAGKLKQAIINDLGEDLSGWWVVTPSSEYLGNVVTQSVKKVARDLKLKQARLMLDTESIKIKSYAGLKEKDVRKKILQGRFTPSVGPNILKGKNIIFVDDSFVSGAIYEEAVRTLQKIGVKRIEPFIYARIDGNGDHSFESRINQMAIEKHGLQPLIDVLNSSEIKITRRLLNMIFKRINGSIRELVAGLTLDAKVRLYLVAFAYYRFDIPKEIDILAEAINRESKLPFPRYYDLSKMVLTEEWKEHLSEIFDTIYDSYLQFIKNGEPDRVSLAARRMWQVLTYFKPNGLDRNLKGFFMGALWGGAIGDSLGIPMEGMTRKEILSKFGSEVTRFIEGEGYRTKTREERRLDPSKEVIQFKKGEVSDDTAMTLGTALALIMKKGALDQDTLVHTLATCYSDYLGYSGSTKGFFLKIKKGASWRDYSDYLKKKDSNGAAIRIAPVALLYHDHPDFEKILKASIVITHQHPLAIIGGLLQGTAIQQTFFADSKFTPVRFVEELIRKTYTWEDELFNEKDPQKRIFSTKLKIVKEFLQRDTEPSPEEVIEKLEIKGARADQSVIPALYAFLRTPESFNSTVIYAVNLGGDTDSIGSMAGTLSGAYNGYRAGLLPWYNELDINFERGASLGKDEPLPEMLTDLAVELVQLRTKNGNPPISLDLFAEWLSNLSLLDTSL